MTLRAMTILGVLVAASAVSPSWAGFGDNQADRDQRWSEVRQSVFGDRAVDTDPKAVRLDVPPRALDAALVPVTIAITDPRDVRGVYLLIDDNPSPVAAHFTFGPGADPGQISLRVRVNAFTDMHAIVEDSKGKLRMVSAYVKASGGCSAPMGMSDEEAMFGMGQMRLRVAGDLVVGQHKDAVLMVRHPNFNGMQVNQDTHAYTPARYIQKINVRFDGRKVFDLDTDISLASNPVITFGFVPDATKGTLDVYVTDSQKTGWSNAFKVPILGN